MLHEPALLGARLRGAAVTGSYDTRGAFHGNPQGSRELDFEQALFGSVRVLRRGQAGVLVPVLESYRSSATTGSEFGGGLGDIAVSARYDLVWAGEHRVIPGSALILGLSLPSGRSPEAAEQPLGSDTTGVGAVRASVGLALEQTFGDWLVAFTALASKRANRHVGGVTSARAIEWDLLAALGYSFSHDVGAACLLSYAFEGNASLDGREVAASSKRLLEISFAATAPLGQVFRAQGALFFTPPFDGVGQNRLAEAGLSLSLIRSFL